MALLTPVGAVTPSELYSFINQGGNALSEMTAGSDIFPAARGLHTLARYTAPLQRFYENFYWRTHVAMQNAQGCLQSGQQCDYVQTGVSEGVIEHTKAWDDTAAEINDTLNLMKVAPTANDALRYDLVHAESLVETIGVGIFNGTNKYVTNTSDLHDWSDSLLRIFAAQGSTAAASIGSAVQYTNVARSFRNSLRGYDESMKQLSLDQKLFGMEKQLLNKGKKDKHSKGLGSLFGAALNIGAKYLGSR